MGDGGATFGISAPLPKGSREGHRPPGTFCGAPANTSPDLDQRLGSGDCHAAPMGLIAVYVLPDDGPGGCEFASPGGVQVGRGGQSQRPGARRRQGPKGTEKYGGFAQRKSPRTGQFILLRFVFWKNQDLKGVDSRGGAGCA